MATTTSPMDSYLMQRTDSEATDESPFGSSLTTPVDEEPPPFENIAERLLSQLDLDLDLDLHLERTPRPQYRDFGGDKDKNRSRSLSKAVGVAKKFARGLVYHQKNETVQDILVERSTSSSTDASDFSSLSLDNNVQSTTESSVDCESVAPADKEAALQFSPKFESPDDQDLSDDALLTLSPNVDTDFLVPVPEQLEESLPMTSPTITQNLFEITSRMRFPPHDRTFSMTAVKDLDVQHLDDDDEEEENDLADITIRPDSDKITLYDTASLFFDDTFIPRMLSLTLPDVSLLVPRALLFVPWYALVGGAILLFPQHLNYVAFSCGYVSSPPRGIQRYAHWAECGLAHVLLFLLSVAWLVKVSENVALLVVLGGQMVMSWKDFRFDSELPVGVDDRQSLFLVAKGLVVDVGLRRCQESGRFFAAVDGDLDSELDDDIDEDD